jgi:hypothetical protein
MVAYPDWARRVAVHGRGAIPLSDGPALRVPLRRTTVVRFVLAGLLALLAALAVWRATALNPRPLTYLPARSTTVVVLDQSKSIDIGAYRRIAALLRGLIAANAPVGLVAFSDTAYEMMPPGSRGSELKPLLRFYTPDRAAGSNVDPETLFPASPWQSVFSGGTEVSAGLILARSILHRDHVRGGTIVLASDLETASQDQAKLAESLVQITHDKSVHLKILPLFPVQADLEFVRQFVKRSTFINPSQLRVRSAAAIRRHLIAASPLALSVVGALLLLALAANELACGRLFLSDPQVSER